MVLSHLRHKHTNAYLIPMDAKPESFGARLRSARKNAGLTQPELAERIGAEQSYVSQWENDKHSPSHKFLKRLSKVLKIDLTDEDDVKEYEGNLTTLKVVGEVRAGHWMEPSEAERFVSFDIQVLENPKLKGVRQFVLQIKGESMNLVYPDGTFVSCANIHDLDEPPHDKDDVIVERRRADGLIEVTCKRYIIGSNGLPALVPVSDDPDYQKPIKLADESHDEEGLEVSITAIVTAGHRINTRFA